MSVTALGVVFALTLASSPAKLQTAPLPALTWMQLGEESRAETFDKLPTRSLSSRLMTASARFLGTPYVVSPLGEGSGKDPDPRLRYDAVDCLTFVEETLALGFARRIEDVEPILTQLRYGEAPVYEDRNHLMEAQWLPHNLAKGYLRDVTAVYGGAATERTAKVITRETWGSASSRALGLPLTKQQVGSYPFWMIPFSEAQGRASRAPTGTLMLVVREDREAKATRMTHLGFLVHADGRTFLRHATRGWKNAVIDEELGHFLGRVTRHNQETDGTWPVVGISLFEPTRPKDPLHPLPTGGAQTAGVGEP